MTRELDQALRLAAFETLKKLVERKGELETADLLAGFQFGGNRIPLVNPQRGIFKPSQMQFLLSIRTVYPRRGARVWYDDQRVVHKQIYQGDEVVEYSFMGSNPESADNRWLREAMENAIPIIYFLGVSPGRYQVFIPSFIVNWDAANLRAGIAFGMPGEASASPPQSAIERRYALRYVKHRLHQASFRDAVIAAYQGRCALSGLPEPILLDAAHIIPDANELYGQPVVPNGLPLSKIHHAAFDAHLIGIDPDYRVHVSDRLLSQNDGPLLESLKNLDRVKLHLPNRPQDHPDKNRLAIRYELFRAGS